MTTKQPAGLLRRIGAMIYDSLLIFALGMFVSVPFVVFQGGEAVEPYTLPHQLAVASTVYLFFVGFWSRTGSTLGMLAWRVRVETAEGRPPSLGRASLRFVLAILSWVVVFLGFLWQLWDRDKLTWHDRLSDTRLVYYPKQKPKAS